MKSALKRYLIRQFGHPRGPAGVLAGRLMAFRNRSRNEWAIAQLDVQPSDRVLEIGFGPGLGIARLAAVAAEVAGVDVSATMLRQARRRNRAAIRAGRVDLRQASVERLPWESDHFDRALAVNSHLFWPDLDRALGELRRVLKPGGVLALTFQPPSVEGQRRIEATTEALAEAVGRAGFDPVETRLVPLERGRTLWLRAGPAPDTEGKRNPG